MNHKAIALSALAWTLVFTSASVGDWPLMFPGSRSVPTVDANRVYSCGHKKWESECISVDPLYFPNPLL